MWDKADYPVNPLRNCRKQLLGARLALLALVLQILVPFSQVIPAPWQMQTGMLLVCMSSGGLQTLPLSWPGEETQQPSRHFQCPICHLQVSCGVGLIPPVETGPAFTGNWLVFTIPVPVRPLQPSLRRYPAQPRAPPILS
ncbi:MAG: hypothetical protein V2J55_12575 [Candidatus Competibacteraceae bacterium]|jgi:hypothetical protein|nr:hypothetical protein [Candidatus Competibacteraceae bacterium]